MNTTETNRNNSKFKIDTAIKLTFTLTQCSDNIITLHELIIRPETPIITVKQELGLLRLQHSDSAGNRAKINLIRMSEINLIGRKRN